jgi:hypothetical protein
MDERALQGDSQKEFRVLHVKLRLFIQLMKVLDNMFL